MADEDEKWKESVERATRPLPLTPVDPKKLLEGIRDIQQKQERQATTGRAPQTTAPQKTTSGRDRHPAERGTGLISGFDGAGSTTTRKLFWNQVANTVNASRKLEGKNVSIIEHPGQGSLINVPDHRATSACVFAVSFTIVTPGSGYLVGEILHPGFGTLCPPADDFGFSFQVDAVSGGGGVTAGTIIAGIGYLVPPSNPVHFGGGGDGTFTANVTFA